MLLRPKTRRRMWTTVAILTAVGILGVLAFGFALAGGYMLLAEAFGPPVGALLTAAVLLFLAICLLIGLSYSRRQLPPPPMIDPQSVAVMGLLAGVAGIEAISAIRAAKKD